MKKILLVEDDPFIIDIYSNQLKKEGFAVDVAKDGQMALEKIKNMRPDLMVLDIILPKMSGLEVLKAVRNNESLKDLKVIIISNLNHKDNDKEIDNLGVIKYFLKIESTPEEIIGEIKEILK